MLTDPSGLWIWYERNRRKGRDEELAVIDWYLETQSGYIDGGELIHSGFNIGWHTYLGAEIAANINNTPGSRKPGNFYREIDLIDIRNGFVWEFKVLDETKPLDSARNKNRRRSTALQVKRNVEHLIMPHRLVFSITTIIWDLQIIFILQVKPSIGIV